ncbi:MAG: glycoside hydrolase [bacterium]|nr:glycoside hydrolase [bacterium]
MWHPSPGLIFNRCCRLALIPLCAVWCAAYTIDCTLPRALAEPQQPSLAQDTNAPSQRRSVPHRLQQVSPTSARSAVEVSIGINPQNPDNLIAAAIMRGYPDATEPNFTFRSTDGGQSWETQATANPDARTQGDDVVVFAQDGTAIHGFISFKGLWEQQPKQAASGIVINRSPDGGASWNEAVAVIDHLNSRTPMEDKPWFAFDRNPHSPHFDNLYCSWTRFDVYNSPDPQDTTQILFARSLDQGRTFQPVIRISDQPGSCIDGDNAVEGAVPCVGVDGRVYVAWAGPRGIELDMSTDGGQSFGKDRVISEFVGGWDHEVEGIGRANGMPVTAVDHSSGPFRGSLYINWIDEKNGDKDVFLISSRDGGQTWSGRTRVNNDALRNGRDQFFTWMSVDPADGAINIAFYDRRDTTGTYTELTLARSIDGGRSFTNYAVDQLEAFACRENAFFGDYLGIDSQQGRVAIAFMHFLKDQRLAVSSAIFDFVPGKLDVR